jgi:hypothetical protein
MQTDAFVRCSGCGMEWLGRDSFIADEEIVLIGYQANFTALEKGLFLFTHTCQATLPVAVQAFADMFAGPIFGVRQLESEACAGYCLHRNALQACPNECECAYVRDILQQLGGPSLEDA